MYLAPRISGKCLWIFTQQDYFRLQTRIYETAFNFHRGSLIKPTFLGHSLCPWNWLGIGVFISERSQFYFCLVYKARSGIRITVATEINREGKESLQACSGVKNPPANAGDSGDAGSTSGSEDPREKRVATHSGRIPWPEETGGLQSIGLQRVRHVLGAQHEHKKGRKERRVGGRRERKELCHSIGLDVSGEKFIKVLVDHIKMRGREGGKERKNRAIGRILPNFSEAQNITHWCCPLEMPLCFTGFPPATTFSPPPASFPLSPLPSLQLKLHFPILSLQLRLLLAWGDHSKDQYILKCICL